MGANHSRNSYTASTGSRKGPLNTYIGPLNTYQNTYILLKTLTRFRRRRADRSGELGTSPIAYRIYSWQKKALSSTITCISYNSAAHRALQVKTGLKAHAGFPQVLRGPAPVIARGRYYFNAPLLRVARGPPRQRRRLQNYTPDLVRLSPDLEPTF